ncbi:SAM-dependent methyltransferase [Pseudactinotalea sp. HY160]|uniref:THUMP-like domain-containing protein n=1 Tax=Pseudactinotalea sp. HY160 TaxID=2654490 RepID=UPI0013127A78|nr:SAM-dependent methyltransferase [Pseudactinotalea sp. HY160]
MDTRGLDLLLTPDGWAFLGGLPPYDEAQALQLGSALRAQGMDADLVAAALTQSRLRAKAAAKFGEFAGSMLFTPDGLEQATRLEIAARHARRFARAEMSRVGDLGCGIGGDALALAALGLGVLAVELDELTARIAAVNLRPFPEARVRHGDALATDLDGLDAVFMDPARRTRRGTRVFDPASYSPNLDAVLELRHRRPLGVKVGPGVPYSALPSETHAEWIGIDGSVVEAGLWFGPLAGEGSGRSALVLGTDAQGRRTSHHLTWRGDADAPAATAPTGPLGHYLYEPDGAVIRSGLLSLVCAELDGRLVDPSIAYITTDHAAASPFATGYRVLDSFGFGLKRLRAYLRERGVGRLTIKKRGTAVTPEALRPQLQLKGPGEATIVLTRVAGAQSVLVVEPLT